MYYLAIDIGASSGRHSLGSIENGKLVLQEIYRFDNGIKNENGVHRIVRISPYNANGKREKGMFH